MLGKCRQLASGSGIAIGIAAGVAIGVAMNNLGVGIAIGVAIGVAFEAGLRKKHAMPASKDDADR